MLRKIMVVLAIALVLGGSALPGTAFAGGGSGLGGGGFRGNHFAGALGGGRKVGDSHGGYGGRVSGVRGGFHEYRRGDVWGHWGAYYGPMVFAP